MDYYITVSLNRHFYKALIITTQPKTFLQEEHKVIYPKCSVKDMNKSIFIIIRNLDFTVSVFTTGIMINVAKSRFVNSDNFSRCFP